MAGEAPAIAHENQLFFMRENRALLPASFKTALAAVHLASGYQLLDQRRARRTIWPGGPGHISLFGSFNLGFFGWDSWQEVQDRLATHVPRERARVSLIAPLECHV